jgi:hypothetical protein
MNVRTDVAGAQTESQKPLSAIVTDADLAAACECAEQCLSVCLHFQLFLVNWLAWYVCGCEYCAYCILPVPKNLCQTDTVATLAARVAKRRNSECCKLAACKEWTTLVSLTALGSDLKRRITHLSGDAQKALNVCCEPLGPWEFEGRQWPTAHAASFFTGVKVSTAIWFFHGFVHSANDFVPERSMHDSTGRPIFGAARPEFFFEKSNARLIFYGLIERDWLDWKFDAIAFHARLLREQDKTVEWLRAQQLSAVVPATAPPPSGQQADSAAGKLDDSFLSHVDLASMFGLDAAATRARLDRWRSVNKSTKAGWREVSERLPREPKYLYRLSAIRHLFEVD